MFLFRTRKPATDKPPVSSGLISSLKRAVVGFMAPAALEAVPASPPPSRPASRATIDLTPYARPPSRATIDLTPYARDSDSATKVHGSDQSDDSSASSATSSGPSSPSSDAAGLEPAVEDKVEEKDAPGAVAPVPQYAPGFVAEAVIDPDATKNVSDAEGSLAKALAAALASDLAAPTNVPDMFAVPFFRTPSPLPLAIEAPSSILEDLPAVFEHLPAAIEPGDAQAPAAIDAANADALVQADAIDDITPALSPASTCASFDAPASPAPSSALFAPTPAPDFRAFFHSMPNRNLPAARIPSPVPLDTALANSREPAALFRAAQNKIVASSVCDAYDGLAKSWAPTPVVKGVSYAPGLYSDAVWGMGMGERAQIAGVETKVAPAKVVTGGLYSWGAQGSAWAPTPEDGLW